MKVGSEVRLVSFLGLTFGGGYLTHDHYSQDTSSIDDVIYAEYRLAAAMKGQRRCARANDEDSAADAVLSRGIAALKPKRTKAQ